MGSMESMAPAEPEDDGRAGSKTTPSRLISNSAYSVVGYAITLPVTLIVNSFVVHRIGIGPYGIWATLTTILGIGSLLDLGVATPLIKYIAEYMAVGRAGDLNALLSTAFVFYLAVGASFVAGMTVAAPWILVHLFHVAASDMSVRVLFFTVLFGFVAQLSFSVLQSLIVGLQRADVNARITLGAGLASSSLITITVALGMGVNGLTVSWLATILSTIGANWIVAKRLFGSLRLDPLLFRPRHLKTILRFSTKVQVTTLTLALNDQVDRTLIAYSLGQAMLGYYALASRAAAALRGVSFALMSGILPAASDLAALGESGRLRQLYLRTNRYLAIMDFGLIAGVGALAQPLVHAWLGGGFGRVAVTLVIILIGYAVWLPNQPTTDILNGLGHPEVRMKADLAFLFLHLPLSVLLIWQFGYYGTIVGTTIALSGTRLYLYVAGSRAIGVPVSLVLRQSFAHPMAAACLAVVAGLTPQWLGAPLSAPALTFEVIAVSSVYLTYSFFFSLDPYDRDLIRNQFFPHMRRLLRRSRAAA